MTAKIIDGKARAREVQIECAERVSRLQHEHNVTPCLAVIIVGDDQPSRIYVRNKMRAAEKAGVISRLLEFPGDANPEEVLQAIDELNQNPLVHGILVQLPLPPQFNIYAVLHRIDPRKDVDGFHLYNVGGLVVGGQSVFSPCTPFGVMNLLEEADIEVAGQNAVIVGASNIVGKPMALMLMQKDATVAVCHARTRDLAQFTILADILVVAAGVPGLIVPQMVKSGAVVIDVGINRLPDGRIVGDVDYEGVRKKASHITPVPGGVGPMTVAMLISNTVLSAEKSCGVI